jgi:endo-1,4-beta-D-glucanase Y
MALRRVSLAVVTAVTLALPRIAEAQSYPFPHTGTYVAGYLPSTVTTADARAVYDKWKTEYLKTDCGAGLTRVEFNNPAGSTVSEGQGYGMVLTAYYGDKAEFDGLWAYAKKSHNADNLMGWHSTCAGFTTNDYGNGTATDGDTDIAFGLLVASYQWGGTYKADALAYIANLRQKAFNDCSASVVMANNGFNNGCQSSNSSYWMPGYYRVFAEFTGDKSWVTAADTAVAVWTKAANASTGLVSNEVDQSGATTSPNVDYNGCRVPWRSVLDYLWNGNAGAKAFTDKITTWVDSKGPSNLVDGYKTDGSPLGGWNGSDCFNGGYATGAMAFSQDRVDRFSTYFKSLSVDNYYETSLRSLYMLMLSGAFWRPGTGTTLPDGGTTADGGTSPTGPGTPGSSGSSSGTSGNDAPSGSQGNGGGGGCAVTQSTSTVAALPLLIGASLLLRRRRRAR